MDVRSIRNRKLGAELVRNLKARHFYANFFENRREAVEYILSVIPEGASITWGGSATIRDIGLTDALKNGNYTVYDRDTVPASEKAQFLRKSYFSDYFLMSTNAISEDGELVNVDGMGNRVSSLIFGPGNVIVVAGMNKVAKTLDDAIVRARTIAAPVNAQRFDIDTPCKITGKCMNCKSPDSICANIVVTRLSKIPQRIKVILINEDLGF